MTKTDEDLKAAFAGESQANRRYLAFAKAAEKEGNPMIAKLFRAVAAAETVHALNHLRVMGVVGTIEENIKSAIAGENYEVVTMYPEFIADAEKDGNKKAATSFDWAWDVEQIHEKLLKEALAQLGSAPAGELEIYVCPVCGNTHIGKPPDKCPVCSTPGARFEKID